MTGNLHSSAFSSTGLLLAASLFAAASFMPLNIMPVLLGGIADDFSLSNRELGNIGSSLLLGFTLLSLSAVIWIEKLRWRQVLALSCLLSSTGFACLVLAPGLVSLYIFWLILGFTAAAPYTVVIRILSESRNTNKAFGFISAIQIGSSALLLWVLPAVLIPRWGFNSIPAALSLTYLLAIPAVLALPDTSSRSSIDKRGQYRGIGINRENLPVWIALICIFVFISGQIGLWAFLERIGRQQSIPPAQLGNILAMVKIIGALAGLTLVVLGLRFRARIPHLACFALVAIGVMLVMSQKGTAAFAVGAWLWEYGYSLYYIYMYALIAVLDRNHRLVVLTPAMVSLGAALGPATAGYLSRNNNFTAVCLFSLLSIMLAALLMSLPAMQNREASLRLLREA